MNKYHKIIEELSQGDLGAPLITNKYDSEGNILNSAYNRKDYAKYKKNKNIHKNTENKFYEKSEELSARIKQVEGSKMMKKLVGKSKLLGIWNVNKTLKQMLALGFNEQEAQFLGNIKTIRSKGFIQELKDMRDAKTGATGFGSLQRHEFDLLLQAIGNLNTDQTPENFTKNLEIVDRQMKRMANLSIKYNQDAYGDKITKNKPYKIKSVDQILNPTSTDIKRQPNINTQPIGTPTQKAATAITRLSDEELERIGGI